MLQIKCGAYLSKYGIILPAQEKNHESWSSKYRDYASQEVWDSRITDLFLVFHKSQYEKGWIKDHGKLLQLSWGFNKIIGING